MYVYICTNYVCIWYVYKSVYDTPRHCIMIQSFVLTVLMYHDRPFEPQIIHNQTFHPSSVQVGNIEQTLTWVFPKKSYLCKPFRRIKVHPLAPLLIQLLRYSMHLLGQMLHLDNSELWCFAGEPPTYIQGKELQAPQCPKTLYNLIHLFTRVLQIPMSYASSILVRPTCEIVGQPWASKLTPPRPQSASRSNQAPLPGRVGLGQRGFEATKITTTAGPSSMGTASWHAKHVVFGMVLGLSERTKISLPFWRDLVTDIG